MTTSHIKNCLAIGVDPLDLSPAALKFMQKGYEPLSQVAASLDAKRGDVIAANTYSSALMTQFLIMGVVVPLQNILAPLRAFTRSFSTDTYKPLATGNLKFITGAATGQVNPVSWESGDSQVVDVQFPVNQYSQSFHVTSAEMNSGMRLSDLIERNTAAFSDTIIQAATAPITAANFQNAIVRSPGTFSFSDLQTARGLLKKSRVRNAILDGEYMAQIENHPSQFQRTPDEGGTFGFGWNEVVENTNWTGADPYVRGFFCNPQALGVIAGLPLQVPFDRTLTAETVELPGLELSVQVSSWFSLATRTGWVSYDVMLGATALDSTAGVILKSQ